jgi:hypothetical protein
VRARFLAQPNKAKHGHPATVHADVPATRTRPVFNPAGRDTPHPCSPPLRFPGQERGGAAQPQFHRLRPPSPRPGTPAPLLGCLLRSFLHRRSPLGLPFLAATIGRAAARFATSSLAGPLPATSAHQVCPPLLAPSSCAKRSIPIPNVSYLYSDLTQHVLSTY